MAKAARMPFMQWFVEDWLNDNQLSRCAPATRAIWADALCNMHREGRTGTLKGTPEELARLCRCTPEEMVAAVKELESKGAANSRFCNGVVTLTNRRMQREHKQRENTAERQRKHRGEASTVTHPSRHASRPLSRPPSESENQRIRESDSDIATSKQNSVSQRTDVFQTLTKADISDARKLLAWMPSAVAAGVVGGDIGTRRAQPSGNLSRGVAPRSYSDLDERGRDRSRSILGFGDDGRNGEATRATMDRFGNQSGVCRDFTKANGSTITIRSGGLKRCR